MKENINVRDTNIDFFRKHPVFTTAEFDYFLASGDRGRLGNRKRLLHYHKEQGHLLLLRQGLYASVPAGASATTHLPDSYVIGAKLTPDATIAYHAALSFNGVAHTWREECIVVTRQPLVRPFMYQDITYRTVSTPSRLIQANEACFGIELRDRLGQAVRVTSLERTLVDVLDRLALGGGWEEVWRSYEAVPYIDSDAVIHYAQLLGNTTTIARVGYFLECQRERWMITDSALELLRQSKPTQPHYLHREQYAISPSKLVSQWNLIVPEWILHRSWEEYDAAFA